MLKSRLVAGGLNTIKSIKINPKVAHLGTLRVDHMLIPHYQINDATITITKNNDRMFTNHVKFSSVVVWEIIREVYIYYNLDFVHITDDPEPVEYVNASFSGADLSGQFGIYPGYGNVVTRSAYYALFPTYDHSYLTPDDNFVLEMDVSVSCQESFVASVGDYASLDFWMSTLTDPVSELDDMMQGNVVRPGFSVNTEENQIDGSRTGIRTGVLFDDYEEDYVTNPMTKTWNVKITNVDRVVTVEALNASKSMQFNLQGRVVFYIRLIESLFLDYQRVNFSIHIKRFSPL